MSRKKNEHAMALLTAKKWLQHLLLLFSSSCLSAKSRLAALESLRQAFSSRVLYDFLTERRLTISDCLERSLRKGNAKQHEWVWIVSVNLAFC